MTSEKQKGPGEPLPSKHMAQGSDDDARATSEVEDIRANKGVEASSSAVAERKSRQENKK